LPSEDSPVRGPVTDTPDSLRQQAAACRRLAAASRTRAGRTSLDALADHFEAQALKLDPSSAWQ
jgi:hypothetical protein